ncbi:hypothetical protein D9M70_650690 [compost metagenome]
MRSIGSLPIRSTTRCSCSCRCSRLLGTVGMGIGRAELSKATFGASGWKSSEIYNCPVSRLPLRACARSPCSTKLEISMLIPASSSAASFLAASIFRCTGPSRCG